jgi:hypothetical protein
MSTKTKTSEPASQPKLQRRKRRTAHTGRANPLALEDELLQLASQVPAEEWARLPEDFNENLDHYLYGSPKKPVRLKRCP